MQPGERREERGVLRLTYPGDPVLVALKVLLHLLPGSQLLEISPGLGLLSLLGELSGEDTEDEVHDEEGAEDDHGDEVEPLPGPALGVVHPVQHVGPALQCDALEHGQHGLSDVVKVGDSVLRPLPVVVTDCPLRALVETAARCWLVRHLPWQQSSQGRFRW